MHISDPEHGKEFLTDELRKHFENVGAQGVEFDVFHHNYSKQEKQFAALYWLRERRKRMEAVDARRFRWIIIVAGLTLVATIVGIYVAYTLASVRG